MAKPLSELFGIPVKEIARICQVSLKTAGRWKAGTICPPHTALFKLRIIYHGDLTEIGWPGWILSGETFISPDGWRIDRNAALTVPFMDAQISALRAELSKALEGPLLDLDEQPSPEEAIPSLICSL